MLLRFLLDCRMLFQAEVYVVLGLCMVHFEAVVVKRFRFDVGFMIKYLLPCGGGGEGEEVC